MFLLDFLFALAVGLLLTAIFTAGFRVRGPWGAWWAFLLIVVLAGWAGAVWTRPIGPPLFGVNWIPLVFVGVLFALLLAAVVPSRPPRTRSEAVAQARAEEAAVAVFGVFFWVLLAGLLFSVAIAYVV